MTTNGTPTVDELADLICGAVDPTIRLAPWEVRPAARALLDRFWPLPNVAGERAPDRTAEAARRLREAAEELRHTPILSGGGDEVTLRMSDLVARIEAVQDAAELLPTPDADPVLSPEQRAVLREAANAYDAPLERQGRHDARRLLDRAIKRIMRREGER